MTEEKEFLKVDVSEDGRGNTYIVRVLTNDDNELIGYPIKNANKRVRVDKDEGTVYFLKGTENSFSIEDLRTAELRSIRTSVPDWVES